MCTRGFFIRSVILGLLWCWMLYIILQVQKVMATSTLYQNFDPYSILEVGRSANTAALKKSFRAMSLKYHPDKNRDPGASDRFMLIKKAYDALTDPISKRNYARYGNPDGPTRMELGIAMPTFDKEHQVFVLIGLLFFVIGVPLMLLLCMSGNKDETSSETLEVLEKGVTDSLDSARGAQELLLASGGESASSPAREEDEAALAAVAKELPVSKTSGKKAGAGPSKAETLFLAHVHRRRDLLSQALVVDLDELLTSWRSAALVMAELASLKGLGDALVASLDLHRCLVQAIKPGAPATGATALLQVPHFTSDRVKLYQKGPRKSLSLPTFLDLPTAELKSSFDGIGVSAQELADIEEFAAVAPRVSIAEASVFVEGEENICQGDLATLQVTLTRSNLRDGEAAGAAHTPLFPSAAIHEAWWVLFSLPGKGTPTRCVRVLDSGREIVVQRKFKVTMVGKCRVKVQVVCEAYMGLDLDTMISFEAKPAADEGDNDTFEGEDEEDISGEED